MSAVEEPEHVPPRRRRVHQVVAARPLVVAEDHRAVLDGDLDAVVCRLGDDRRPHLLELLEVLRQRLVLVVADERVDHRHAELLGCLDHATDVGDHLGAMVEVGVQRVRVVTEAGDLDAPLAELPDEVLGLIIGEVGAVDVRHAGVPPASGPPPAASRRPPASRSRSPTPTLQPRTTACPGRRR